MQSTIRGEVVGWTRKEAPRVAFLYRHGAMQDLGEWEPTGINQRGMIVGTDGHAVSYSHGKLTDLGTLSGASQSVAYGVNDLGLIVGTSGGHAFLDFWGSMMDLNTLIPPNSGWTVTEARGINDFGEIVGTGIHNGVQRGFLLTLHFGF